MSKRFFIKNFVTQKNFVLKILLAVRIQELNSYTNTRKHIENEGE